jgi:hypothetical protein
MMDPEIDAMIRVFAALKGLEPGAQARVIEYVVRRLDLGVGTPNQTDATSSAIYPDQGSARPTGTKLQDTASVPEQTEDEPHDGLEGISPIAQKWMRRNGLSPTKLSALFSLGVDEIDLVARKVPGKSARERLRNVMLLQGIAAYLNGGVPRIDNDKLKEAATHYDADAGGNFATYAKEWAAEISGSRAAGDLTLTTRGLNAAKDLIAEMTA